MQREGAFPMIKSKRKPIINKGEKKPRPYQKKKKQETPKPDGVNLMKPGPLFVRPAAKGSIHPALDQILLRPFVSSVFIDENGSIAFPVGDNKIARVTGLHTCMKNRFFRGISPHKIIVQTPDAYGNLPKRLASSKNIGSAADRALENAIRTGQPPSSKDSPYAEAVWKYWSQSGHVPVLAQLPVIISKANVGTMGDYFTVYQNPRTETRELWLWELKTGWQEPKAKPEIMDPPLSHVPITAINRWNLQVLLTKMAYERELGLKIDFARVIQVYQEREDVVPGSDKAGMSKQYHSVVKIYTPADLTPPRWTEDPVLLGILYDSLKADTRKK